MSRTSVNLPIKKATFLEAYKQCMGVMTAACEMAGYNRSVVWEWRKADPEFEKALAECLEVRKDFAESKLFEKIKNGDTACLLFYLKTQCRDRGYIERYETSVNTAADSELKQMVRKFFGEKTEKE